MSYLHSCNAALDQTNAISLEFEQQWECVSDINEDDLNGIKEDMTSWWGNKEPDALRSGPGPYS